MDFDLRKVAEHVRAAKTEELLDRVTVYREDMEPAAVDLMENELARRGFSPERIAEHGRERRATALVEPGGEVVRCALCDRPAVTTAWSWRIRWREWGLLPRRRPFCERHAAAYKDPPRPAAPRG